MLLKGKRGGITTTRLYKVWYGMKYRCLNPNSPRFKDWGGRGITVCPEWLEYESFEEWSISNGFNGNAPRGKCTLDRIDNNKGYSPDNCRWVDMKTQAKNKRKTERISRKKSCDEKYFKKLIGKKQLCLNEVAQLIKIPKQELIEKLKGRKGWYASDMRLLINLLKMSYKDFSVMFGVEFHGGDTD